MRVSGPRAVNSVKMGDVSQFTLLCLDLNNFKPVNDRFGHLEGDRVLRDIADRLRQTAPAGAVVARYGGDEFLIALPGYDANDAAEAVAQIHAGVESYNCGLPDKNGMTLRISVSIGMSVFPGDGQDSATLLSIADQRMFRMKTSRKASRGEAATRG
jgi:diguanylate cyclase (GGDEF)-like protein